MNYFINLLITIAATGLWLYMYQDKIAFKIRQSKWWFPAWLFHLYLGATAVVGWFNVFLM